MEELRFSIDEEKYDDRHGQVLSLGGWYAGSDRQEMSFCLVGDGNQELVLADPERYERPDVAQALEADFGEFLPGFRLRIPKADQLAEQFQQIELFLTDGEKRVSVWKKSADELKSFLNQSLLEYHLDRVEILYDTMLEIQGWAVDQRGETEITALNQDGSPIACRMSRGRRPDVVERCSLDEIYKNQEIGFRISASLDEISGKRSCLNLQDLLWKRFMKSMFRSFVKSRNQKVFLTGF